MQFHSCMYKHLKRSVILVALLGALVLTGCDRPQQAPPSPPVPEVAVVTVQPQKVTLAEELPGRTAAFRIAEIRPQVNGLIQKRLFTEGSDVKAGQVLFLIDAEPFQAALDSAKAALGRTEANLVAIRLRALRLKELLADKAVSQQDYDDAAAALKQTEAEIQYYKAAVRNARINQGYCRVTAPISGRIGRSNVTEGALVTAYQPTVLATIQQLDPIYVDIPQSTTELLRLRRHLKEGLLNQDGNDRNEVTLIQEDDEVYPRQGTLQFRDVTVDPTTGSVILRAIFPNPENTLLPGMFVRAVLQEGVNPEALLVPQQAVSRDPKGTPRVLVVDAENKVQQRMLSLDRAIGDKWLVTSGLTPGERVIVEGMLRVRPGMGTKVVSFKENKTGPVPGAGSVAQLNKRTDGGV